MEPVVETSCGKVRGSEENDLVVFRGVPFARPPLGPLRFRPPEPPEPWRNVREATRFAAAAPQNVAMMPPMLAFGIGEMSEDCLYLNVWTPGTDAGRRPVLVWIHGGAFVIGAGSQALYDGSSLARRGDVVVVTINYRLGALGFLPLRSLGEVAVPASGNEGLLDQIAALEWVQREIGAFGGDPRNVTIFGESAGSISCAVLLGTPRARGLFRRAILQSGSASCVSPPEQAKRVAAAFLNELELDPTNVQKLKEAPPEKLLEAQQRVFLSLAPEVRGIPFQPVVDGDVLPREPFDAIREGLSRDVSVLAGTCLDEMKLFAFMDPALTELDEAALLARCEKTVIGGEPRRAIEIYREERGRRGESVLPRDLWLAMESDRLMRFPAMRLAELQSRRQRQTYAFLFTWTSPWGGGALGACHALDLPFVFGTVDSRGLREFAGAGPEAQALVEKIQHAWIAFARSGDPSHPGIGEWPAYDGEGRATMLLGKECRTEYAPLEAERAFWESTRVCP